MGQLQRDHTERQDWARGWAKLKEFTEREGHARVPYEHKEGAFPLGQWVAEQRRAYGAGQVNGRRAARLEKLGMAWTAADARFQENLAAARVYYQEHWTLCAPRSAAGLDKPIGQWLSNLRRPGALAEHPEWEAALKAVDEDWNPPWSTEWQRHYAALRELMRDEDGPAQVLPGFTVHGMDVGKWLARQRKPEVWAADGQRERLEQLGITPPAPAPEEPKVSAETSTAPVSAFERGVAALAQYKARTGSVTVPRGRVEQLEDGAEVRLGVWIMNQKSRRAKLTTDKLSELAALGLGWALEG
ncbi:helicase associated domain-containing protein [Streptomyces griseofuscus]|uniref:helicase associated domain-containing protein n=1 Tax=Streptomyces griseofuscus TaxID=146922 RepID=UPI00382CC43C